MVPETSSSEGPTTADVERSHGAFVPAFEVASRASRGGRSYQEDTARVWPEPDPAGPGASLDREVVAVLADGMGGHAGGALASRRACEAFVEVFRSEEGADRDRLVRGLEAANRTLGAIVDENPLLIGMGCTLVGVAFGREGAEWVSVGDSPLMLYRNGEIALLNEDHSLAPELDRLAAAGHISAEEARRDPRRHMLRSAVTGEEIELIDLSRKPLRLEPDDYVILASDGLQTLEPSEIERIVTAYAGDGADAVARALIRAVDAMRDPHQDNTTVVVVRVMAAKRNSATS